MKPFKKIKSYLKCNFIGFYSINSNSVISTIGKNNSDNFIKFLCEIRENNPNINQRIVLVLDNFKTHKSKKVLKECKEVNIHLVYLPPYSPDLNPIEFIWKSVKRVVSETLCIIEEFIDKILNNSNWCKS